MERRESHIDLVDKITSIQVELAKGFAEFHAHHKESASDVLELKEMQNKILYTLYGNGKEGIITTVAKMHEKLGYMWWGLSVLGATFLAIAVGANFNNLTSLLH
jgi:predicted transcriptional regulator